MALSLLFPFAIAQLFSASFENSFNEESDEDFDSFEFDEESEEFDFEENDELEEDNDDLFF